MNKEFEKELVKLLNKYYSTNWDYVWEFEGETIETKFSKREEVDDDSILRHNNLDRRYQRCNS